jgi:putative hemolysin
MEIFIILVLILINGVFSMAEIAMVSARKSRLEFSAKRGDKGAKTALDTINSPNKFLSTVQIGITLIGILTGIFSGEKIQDDVTRFFIERQVAQGTAETLSVVVVVGLLTFFSLVLGELVPKRIGLSNPEGIAKVMSRPMRYLALLTAPFVWTLTAFSDLIIMIFRIKSSPESKVTEEEIKAIIQEGTEGGEVQEIEQDIVERVFHLGDRTISSLMTHRNDVIYLHLDDSQQTIRETVNKEMHSLYPVYDEDKGYIKGIVLLKDLFRYLDTPDFRLQDHLLKPSFITEHVSAYEVLIHFKASKVHYGIITDEFGQTQGIVTMKDLLHALVGDFSDFYAEEFSFVEREDGSWLIDGQYPLVEFFRHFDLEEEATDLKYTTLGGLIMNEVRSVPEPGQVVTWMNFEIEVVDMDGPRIDKVIVKEIKK